MPHRCGSFGAFKIIMFSYRIFDNGSDKMLAVCDMELLGKTLEGDIELTVTKDFYHEKECNSATALKLAKKSTIINAIGNEIVQLLIDKKMVDKSSVIMIGNVMHAQIISI